MLTLRVFYFLLYGLAHTVSESTTITTESFDPTTSYFTHEISPPSTTSTSIGRKVVLASFYTIHQAGIIPCDTIIPENIILSIIHQHSILTANEKILSKLGVKLVSDFADTCDDASVTLQKAVGIIGQSQDFCERKSDQSHNKPGGDSSGKNRNNEISQTLIAATGVFRGEIGDSINYLLRAFCLPVIASVSSSAEMDNPITYPYFLRTGASDVYKAQVILDILQSQQWYHILVISDSSSTGVALTNQFKTLIEYCYANDDIHLFRPPCVENYFQLSFFDDSNEGELETEREYLKKGLNNSATRVIVMLMEDRAIDKTLLFLDTLDSNPGRWQFILSTKDIQSNTLLEYSFAVEENIEAYLEFNEVIKSVTLKNTENPWVQELIENENLCCWNNVTSCPYSIQCDGSEKIINVPEKASHEAIHVYNAIMLLATAIKNIHDEYCKNESGICENLINEATGRMLLNYLLNASFADEYHQKFELFNRSATPVYNVFQMQEGNWKSVLTQYNPYIGPVPSIFNFPIKEIPGYDDILQESVYCQPNCDKTIIDMRGRCCWNCRSCNYGEFINNTLMMCQNCSIEEMPNENLTGCILEPKPPLFYEPTAEMWVLIGVSIIGVLISTILTTYIYLFRKTPMVMASTPDLCYLQSFAQSLLFIIAGMMLPSPNMIVCGTVWTISSVLLVTTHAIFLIKAIRLSRPRFYTKLIAYANTPVKCSLIMLFVFFASQLLICVIWILLRPPKPLRKFHEDIVHCSSNNEVQTIVLMILPLALIIATFYFQRNAIRNKIMFQVRQARIGLAGTLCFIVNYGVLLPLIFMEGSPAYVRATILMCIPFLTALVSLTTMHLPIAYELFFRKKQNSHEYVSRERSRQFQAGNFVYYVDAMLLRRANRTRTQTTVNSNL